MSIDKLHEKVDKMTGEGLKHYGFDPDKVVVKSTDIVLGVGTRQLPRNKILPDGKTWDDYLPEYEPQFGDGWDSYGCTVWGTQNAIEFMLNCIEGGQHNFSERFVYNGAGVMPPGDDPSRIAQWIRENGMINEADLPFSRNKDTFYTPRPMTSGYLKRGQEWVYKLGYEWLWTTPQTKEQRLTKIKDALPFGPIGASVTAWIPGPNGTYIDNGQPNTHWCVIFVITDKGYKVFDSYDQSVKILSFDHNIQFAERYHLEVKKITPSTWQYILDWFKSLFKQAQPILNPLEEVVVKNIETTESITDIITRIALEEGVEPELAIAVAKCESSLNPKARLVNSPRSIDRGLYQINSFYHPNVTDAQADNPEFACRWFCKAVKDKKLKVFWTASSRCWGRGLSTELQVKYNVMSSKKFGALSSSTNPEQLAKTVEAIVMGGGVIITFLAWKLLDIELKPEDLTSLSAGAGIFASNVMLIWGLIRKVIAWYYARKVPQA